MNGTARFLNFLNAVYSKMLLKNCILVFKLTPTAAKKTNKNKNTEQPANAFHERERPVMQPFILFYFFLQSSCQDQLAFMLLAHK